ncbi:hypothetical protein [Bradyrhizobium sp. WSM2254]|uniref:hypothetical protein n=1 Tax=Bradyrhizobium sp. WSM2254 TaxID=1188263 RepID=UPI0004048B0C
MSGASGSADIGSTPFATKIDLVRHVDYVHINPVKHGLVDRVHDWAPSSFHRHVELDNYSADWQAINRMMAAITESGDREEMGFRKGSTHLTG